VRPQPRYELKYWCQESEARDVLGRLAGLLDADPHAGGADGPPVYTVTSLYYDTPQLDAYWEKLEGLRRRDKLRLRCYGDAADGWVELKAKHGRRLRKYRLALEAPALARLALGDLGVLDELELQGPAARLARAQISHACSARRQHPAVITRYVREAWLMADDPTVRLTLDRSLVCWGEDLPTAFLDPGRDGVRMLEPALEAPLILEVKVTGPVPGDVSRALREAGLARRSISKYGLAIERTRHLPAPGARLDDSPSNLRPS
jgi:VTC domain